jgi:hypothetical protein
VDIPILDQLKELASWGNFEIITDLGLFVSRLAGVALLIAGVAFFIYFVWAGIRWILAGSDTNKVEEARHQITNALLGLTIVAAAWAIFLIVNYFFGLNLVGGNSGTGTGGTGSGGVAGVNSCVCGTGGCASVGQIGPIGLGGECYQCTTAGWQALGNNNCGPITCGTCR